jgi:GxxExxY protein
MELLHQELTGEILKAFYAIHNRMGFGFAEKIYENSLSIELEEMGHKCVQQHPISVYYKGQIVGQYFADILVDDLIIIELKAAELIVSEHEAQLINYLKATKYEVGMLLNFGAEAKFKRKVFANARKPYLEYPPSTIYSLKYEKK